MDVRLFNLVERPDLADRWRELDELWPPFMHFDPAGVDPGQIGDVVGDLALTEVRGGWPP